MARLLAFGLFIWSVYGGKPTHDLIGIDTITKVAFYDFDKTMTVFSWGGVIRDLCNASASLTCTNNEDMVTALDSLGDAEANVTAAMGGTDRINRLIEHFTTVMATASSIDNIFILSTSWAPVPAEGWKNFIFRNFELAGLDTIFPKEKILTLDDPGVGIPADKGSVAEAKLVELGVTEASACIFSDDSSGNVASAAGKCDTNYLTARKGMDETDLNYVEARTVLPNDCKVPTVEPTASPSVVPTASPTTTTVAGTTEDSGNDEGSDAAARRITVALMSMCIFVLYS
eukprot:545630_1